MAHVFELGFKQGFLSSTECITSHSRADSHCLPELLRTSKSWPSALGGSGWCSCLWLHDHRPSPWRVCSEKAIGAWSPTKRLFAALIHFILIFFRLGRFPLPIRARLLNFDRRGVFLETGANGWCFGSGHLSSRSSRDITTSIQWVLDYERQGRAGGRLLSVSNLFPPRGSPSRSKLRVVAKTDTCGCNETSALRSEVRVWPDLGSLEVFPYVRRSTKMGGETA